MNRRSFIKKVGALIGIAYTNPIALIPKIPSHITISTPIESQFIKPDYIASEGALALQQEDLCMRYIRPAAKKLAKNIDEDIARQIMRRN
jgi:hypothetical protein